MYAPKIKIRCSNHKKESFLKCSVPTKQESGDSDGNRILQNQKQKLLQNYEASDITGDLGLIGASFEKGASVEKGAPINARSPVSVGAPVKNSKSQQKYLQ